MPAYYKIKVVEIDKDEAMVKMHLKVINPDTMKIYNTIGFGLQLLYNFKWEGFPIATEIDSEDLSNPEWCTKYANGFVKSVEISERTKPRIPFAINDYEDPFWQSPELWPEAVLKVYCTDPAWLAHITVNEEWESYAYDVSRSYDDHEPILLNKNASEKAISSPDSFGWMPIPSFLFSQGSYRLPSVVLFPKFTESSYVVEKIRDFSKEDHETVLSLHCFFGSVAVCRRVWSVASARPLSIC